MVLGGGVGDISFGFSEFGLAEFDDGAKTEIVAGLREVERQPGLFAQLAFEEYRHKVRAGQDVEASDYAAKYGLDVEEWLTPSEILNPTIRTHTNESPPTDQLDERPSTRRLGWPQRREAARPTPWLQLRRTSSARRSADRSAFPA